MGIEKLEGDVVALPLAGATENDGDPISVLMELDGKESEGDVTPLPLAGAMEKDGEPVLVDSKESEGDFVPLPLAGAMERDGNPILVDGVASAGEIPFFLLEDPCTSEDVKVTVLTEPSANVVMKDPISLAPLNVMQPKVVQ